MRYRSTCDVSIRSFSRFAVLLICLCAGCHSSPTRTSPPPERHTALLIGEHGDVLGTFGPSRDQAIAAFERRLAYARSTLSRAELMFDPTDGRVLMATDRLYVNGVDPLWMPAAKTRTLVWRNWFEEEAPLAFDEPGAWYVSPHFVELRQRAGSRWVRSLVDLREPSARFVVPDDLEAYDVLPNGVWLGMTKTEILYGRLTDESLAIERRMPFISNSMPLAVVRWASDGKRAIVSSLLPSDGEPAVGRNKTTELLDCETWRFVEQPEDMYLYEWGLVRPEDVSYEGVPPETVLIIAQRGRKRPWGVDGPWDLAALGADGELYWSNARTGIRRDCVPRFPAAWANLLLCSERATKFIGGSPDLMVTPVVPHGGTGNLLHVRWTSLGGWLAAPAQPDAAEAAGLSPGDRVPDPLLSGRMASCHIAR